MLASAVPLTGLYFLDIGCNDITDEGARHLLRWPGLARVAQVEWGGNKCEDEEIIAWHTSSGATSSRPRRLSELRI